MRITSITTTKIICHSNFRNVRFVSNQRYLNDKSVNAFVYTSPPHELRRDGPLRDITIAVKDNISTKDMPTTCSSAILRGPYFFALCMGCDSFISLQNINLLLMLRWYLCYENLE